MDERDEAIKLANKVLDTPNRDPDDDLSMLSRQFLRAIERVVPPVISEKQAAYALLWRMHTTDWRIHAVRAALLSEIGKDGQRSALEWAFGAFGPHDEPPDFHAGEKP